MPSLCLDILGDVNTKMISCLRDCQIVALFTVPGAKTHIPLNVGSVCTVPSRCPKNGCRLFIHSKRKKSFLNGKKKTIIGVDLFL